MKRIITGIFVTVILLVSAGCSSEVKDEVTNNNNNNNNNQSKTEGNNENTKPVSKSVSKKMSEHQGHSTDKTQDGSKKQIVTQAKLNVPKEVTPNQPINLAINIQDQAGKPVSKFDVFQEKLMHLIVVSNDLEHFDHLHPEYKKNGRFEVNAKFPHPGEYALFSDYKPAGQTETVSLVNVNVPGTVPLPKSLSKYEKTKIISDTKVNLNIDKEKIKAGEDVNLTFEIKDKNNQAVKDIQPYLGEKGHLVIIKGSSVLSKSDYIHAHSIKDDADGKVKFYTKFPQSGTYKMWMQFKRNGEIKTADFWINVE
ncbi:MAG: hypothetical protein EAZ87_12970 [Nostocales cyanobacterium]|nr:MAG: hypothetical protein EAZ87_12970 [Nostocales cyanobacterium]